MNRKQLEEAARDYRVAVLPEYLQPGSRVWYWRESLCEDDLCMDSVTPACPLNRGFRWYDAEARSCAMAHPALEETTVWSIQAAFTAQGVEWIVNDLPAVADCRVRSSFHPSREEAEACRPGRVSYG